MNTVSSSTADPELVRDAQSRTESETRRCHREAHQAQASWAAIAWQERLRCIARIPGLIADDAENLAASVFRPAAAPGEILSGEVAPLADACRYTAKRGGSILRDRKLPSRDRAWWMGRIDVVERSEPWGIVLVIGPSNYPLLLPGVQVIQALAAGNSVLVKAAPQTEAAMLALKQLCVAAGIPEACFQILPTEPEAAKLAIDLGVDKVIFTGSARTGTAIASQLAATVTPAVLELSGCDAVYILPDADLDRAAETMAVALQMNGGETCIGPRRVFASPEQRELLAAKLIALMRDAPAKCIHLAGFETARRCVEQALQAGAVWILGDASHLQTPEACKPVVLGRVTSDMDIARSDIFAPVLSLMEVDDVQRAIRDESSCRYALGASIFAPPDASLETVAHVKAGCITIGDIVVPTADPRVSFGGWGASGYGVTRGLEGLREMTRLKTICIRRGNWLPHLTTPAEQLSPLMLGLIRIRHGTTWAKKWQGIRQLMSAGRKRNNPER